MKPTFHAIRPVGNVNRKHNPVCVDLFVNGLIKVFDLVAAVGTPRLEPAFQVEGRVDAFSGKVAEGRGGGRC